MKKRTYSYDPQKQVLLVLDDGKLYGYYGGMIAEQKFEELLETDVTINLVSCKPVADQKVE